MRLSWAAWVLAASALLGTPSPSPSPSPAPATAESRMGTVYLVLLKKGPAWSAEQTPQTRAVQEAHMANIRALWADKKMIIAGPLGDNGEIRGIFVFQAASLEEAQALAASDPAVKAGRLTAEIHPWYVETRALPEAGSYCRP